MAFLAPLAALAALAAIPIIILYLLKMKRQERVVPSTYLWRETIKDVEANVPLQMLRTNLLLILQLIILTLLVLALMRPTRPASYRLADRSVLVLDISASMLATDGPGGRTRFDEARDKVADLIDSLGEGQRMMIVAGDVMVTDGFESQKGRLHAALGRVAGRQEEADCAVGIQMAWSALSMREDTTGAGPGPAASDQPAAASRIEGRIYLVSDGAGLVLPTDLEDLPDFLTYYTVGSTGDNVGIIGLQFRRPSDRLERGNLFVNVANFAASPRKVIVSLRRRGEAAPIDAGEIDLAGGLSSGVTFDRDFPPGDYTLAIDTKDSFPLDDSASLVLGPNRPLSVLLVGEGNPVIERFLAAAPNVDSKKVEPSRFVPADDLVDLYLFDGVVPSESTRGRTAVYFFPQGPIGPFQPVGIIDRPQILDWNRDDPVMRFVSLSDVRLAASSAEKLAPSPRVIPLVWTESSPLIAYANAAGVRHYCIAFDILRSTWPRTVSLPIFMGNIVEEARRAQRLGQALIGRTGQVYRITGLARGEAVRVEKPDQSVATFNAEDATADFRQTDQVGFYRVTTASGPADFALNLASPRESNIAPRRELIALGGEKVEGAGEVAGGTEEIWVWAALAALALLMVEWWVYHRRIA